MSQHDFELTTADANTGVTMRAGINAMAQALATCSSGATEPSTMYAYQFWADTTSGYMKQRNAANNAWLTRWQLSVGELAALSGATFTGLVNLAAGADIASAATIDLTAATGNCPRITGTTATSAVTMNTGQQMRVVADGAWPLTYDATTNKLNTGANYTCKAGDVIDYYKDLSGVVHGEISRPTGVASGNVLQANQVVTTVASASSVALAATTQNNITGTTAITAFTGTAGVTHHCKATGALPLTHHATNLIILQTGASVTLDAGATFDVYMLTASTCEIRNIQLASGFSLAGDNTIVQVVSTQTGAVATGGTIMPQDDTIPQITEGDEYMTLAITPTSATNKLEITVTGLWSNSASARIIAALFINAGADAIAVGMCTMGASAVPATLSFKHTMVAGTTSATTFRVRAGTIVAGTTTFNGVSGGRLFGGVAASSIVIREIAV